MPVNNRWRLESRGAIDRTCEIDFVFNRKRLRGYGGDTLASALLANGIIVTGRSFKYHRPRGIFTCGSEEPGSFVELLSPKGSANQPVTKVALESGLRARSVNCWPSARLDFGMLTQLLSPIIPSGFYYKTFMAPSWRFYEPMIRKMAGLANAPKVSQNSDCFRTQNAHCDVLIIGGGPAGLQAARIAAGTEARVILLEQEPELGGSRNFQCQPAGDQTAKEWVQSTRQMLSAKNNVKVLTSTMAWGYRDHNLVLAHQQDFSAQARHETLWRIRAGNVLLATGATERMLVFENNDRPGVMLSSAVLRYLNQYAVVPGNRIAVFTNNNGVNGLIKELADVGRSVVAVIDTRTGGTASDLVLDGVENYFPDHVVKDVKGSYGVRSITVAPASGGRDVELECDLLAVSGGWNPSVQLWVQSGGTLQYDENSAAFVPNTSDQNVSSIGSAAGCFNHSKVLRDSRNKAVQVLKESGYDTHNGGFADDHRDEDAYRIEPKWEVECAGRGKAFVDLVNDVTTADMRLAIREGYDDIELLKRYTTLGMGLDQGKTGNVNASGILARQTGKSLDEIGLINYRAPVSPVTFGPLGMPSGPIVRPYKTTPITRWNIDNGAVMYEAGANWRRPGYYLQPGETMQMAINREAEATRNGVAIYDGSPLGTFEVRGQDAAIFLERIYTIDVNTIDAGQGRYGLMLTEDGLILDDGICFRLDKSKFLLSTSTGNVEAVYRHLTKHRNLDYPDYDVKITDLTLQWMNATICGPEARKLLEELGTDIDVKASKFPFMGIREGTVAGKKARVARVSFTGELSFEINVRKRDMLELWLSILNAGKAYGITPIGSETNHVLRVEKGFLSMGHEVDGTVDPFDLGMAWVMSTRKDDFVGKRAVTLKRASTVSRQELVGLNVLESDSLLEEGAPIVSDDSTPKVEGHVTAAVWSVAKQQNIALALLAEGRNRMGTIVTIKTPAQVVNAEVCEPCFYDPKGHRLKG